MHTFGHSHCLNAGRSTPVTLPYVPKISSRCARWTFLVKPDTTITLKPPALPLLAPLPFLGASGDMETSEPDRRRRGDERERVRDLPRSMSRSAMVCVE